MSKTKGTISAKEEDLTFRWPQKIIATKENDTTLKNVVVHPLKPLENKFVLHRKKFSFDKNKPQRVALVGPVASGKTAFLLSLLNEMKSSRSQEKRIGQIWIRSSAPIHHLGKCERIYCAVVLFPRKVTILCSNRVHLFQISTCFPERSHSCWRTWCDSLWWAETKSRSCSCIVRFGLRDFTLGRSLVCG